VPDIDGLPGCRFLDHNISRIWTREFLSGPEDGRELRRARALAPFAAEADVLLDIHSTPYNPTPFFPIRPQARRQALAAKLGSPATHVLIPEHVLGDAAMAEYGRLGDEPGEAVGLMVECGLHYARASVEVATSTCYRLLAHYGLVSREAAEPRITWHDTRPRRDFRMTDRVIARTGAVRYLFEPSRYQVFGKGEIVAWDGDEPIRAPYDDCCPLWVPKRVGPGGVALIFTRLERAAEAV
jgi:predicted deacylase